jgi:hypothetical protein
VVSADKMMVQARGPVWHRKHQEQGIIPKGLHGLDTDETWSYSKSDGWVYGHGTFCLVACKTRILGAFKWMRNSANEAKRMWVETGKLKGLITTVLMDSKADDVIAVLEEIRHRFELSGSEPDVQDLRKEAIQAIARIEVDARRFANEVSAENSIHDACVRRLGYTQVLKLDRMTDVLTLQAAIEALGQRIAIAPPDELLGAPPA